MKRSMIQSSQSLIQPPVKKSHFANNNNNDQLLLTMSNFPLDLLTHPSAFQEVDSNQAQSSSTGKSSSSNSKIDYSQPIIIIRDDDDDDDDEESDFTDQFLLNQPIKSSPAFDMNEEMEIIFIDDEKLPNKEMIDNIRECDTVTLTNNNNNDDDGNNAANLLINESCPILDITPFTFPSTDATNTCLNNADADENAVESINNNNNNNNGIEIIEQIIIAPPIQQQALDAESSENPDKQSLSLLNYQSKKIPELINDADDHQVKEKLRLEREKYVDTWNKMSDIEKCSKDFISKFGINIWQDPVESVLDINYYLNDSNNSKEFEDELVKNFTSKESDRNFEIIDNAFSKVMESIVNDVNKGTQQSELLNLNINENADLGIDLLLSEDKLQNTLENSCIISGSQKEISTRLTGSAELGKDSAGKNSSSFTDEEAIESILIAMNKMWFKH